MKKIVTGALALSVITSMAMADFTTGMRTYLGAGLAMEDLEDISDDGMAIEVSAGGIYANNFGVEAKISKSISPSEDNGVEVDVTTLSLFATYNHPLSQEFTVTPKIGFTYFKTDVEYIDDDSNVNISYGIDLKFNLTQATNIYLGYTAYNPEFKGNDFDANHFSFGIQQKF
jgi:hypothetical protein